jgi:hypothetical protein
MLFDTPNKGRRLLAANRCAFAKLSDQIFPGLFDKTQYRPQPLFAPVFCVVPFARPLLVAVNGLVVSILTRI